jgi:serine/threonine protein phosphatase 1
LDGRLKSPRRILAIGDIHGCSQALSVLVRAIAPGPTDLVVTLGDQIDRGPDTKGVIDRLLLLRRRCEVVCLLGNHEQMLLDSWDRRHRPLAANPVLRGWLRVGGLATLDSYGPSADLGDLPADHLEFLTGCVPYFETEDHIFLHANYHPDVPLEAQTGLMIRWESLGDFLPGPHRSGKTAIVGHTPQRDGEILDLGHLKAIDTYCCGGGWLTALEVATGRFWQANQRGEVRERALASLPQV